MRPQAKFSIPIAVLAIAALAIAAIAFGGVPAQAGNLPAVSESVISAPQQEHEEHAQPEACPDTPVRVFNSGRLALFDAYWYQGSGHPEEKETLENNLCPPEVTITREEGTDEEGQPNGEFTDTVTRDASPTVNIKRTVIHIPNSYKETLSFNSTTERTKYPFMFDKWNLEDTNSDGTVDALHHNHVWVLPTCDPAYSGDAAAGDDDLCLIFSAALLEADHWATQAGGKTPGPVQFEFEASREKFVAPSERGQLFAFKPYDGDGVTSKNQVTWRTDNLDTNELVITPETYEYRQWAFSEAGTYVLSVHVKGHPNESHHKGKTLTSVVRQYIFHVGTLADLGASVAITKEQQQGDTSTDINPGDTVNITVTATNAGPDDAPSAKVNVKLSAGLTYVSHDASAGTYDRNIHPGWNLDELTAPAQGSTGPTEATLTITATVDEDTRGQELVVGATISATENIGATLVPVLDPNPGNNIGLATITPTEVANTPAEWYVLLSVEEGSSPGTAVGNIIRVRDPDPDDSLFFELTGEGHENFLPIVASGGVQIAVASGANLDYEVTPAYELVLSVSDGVDEDGNPDGSPRVVDDTVPVRIDIDDVNLPASVRLTVNDDNPTAGSEIILTAELLNGDQLQGVEYVFYTKEADSTVAALERTTRNTYSVTRSTAQTEDFFVQVIGQTSSPPDVEHINSNVVTVTWQ